jgi:hypothetical protein
MFDIPIGITAYRVVGVYRQIAAHEYAHAWAFSLGGLTAAAWLNEGLAEFIGFATVVNIGKARTADVDSILLEAAIRTGEASRCLVSLEDGGGLWPGDIGYLAVKALVAQSPNGMASLRLVNQDPSTRTAFDQAFQRAFGTTKSSFYNAFPIYVASLGGPRSCS